MGVLLFAGADRMEFDGLLRRCRNVTRMNWPVHWARAASLEGREIWMAANGAGPLRSAAIVEAALLESGGLPSALDAIVSIGFCGALDPGLRVGGIVVASAIVGPSGEFAAAQPVSSLAFTCGPVVSIDHVAQTAGEKKELRASGAIAVEMEAAGMAPKVREYEVRFFCIRSVSDLAGEGFSVDFNSVVRPDGRFDVARILLAAVSKPWTRVPELLRLRSRCRKASETLGDFVASCRF